MIRCPNMTTESDGAWQQRCAAEGIVKDMRCNECFAHSVHIDIDKKREENLHAISCYTALPSSVWPVILNTGSKNDLRLWRKKINKYSALSSAGINRIESAERLKGAQETEVS